MYLHQTTLSDVQYATLFILQVFLGAAHNRSYPSPVNIHFHVYKLNLRMHNCQMVISQQADIVQHSGLALVNGRRIKVKRVSQQLI